MIYTGAIGAIILMARNRSFTSTTLRLLSAIANQTASSIEHIWLKRKVSEKEKKITKLYSKLYDKEARKAIMDALTGLFNRRYFVELMDSESKKGKQLCLIMLDIDFFKSYNDTFGHVEGDHLLRNIGQLIQTKLKNVKACRYGGEEFAFILETNIEEAIKTAEIFRRAFETFYPEKAKRQVTVSLGVGQRKKGENVEAFTKRVDSALYKAKESGRNQVQIAK
jgi:diguanylate cyclase (GGDEF)-like protein